LQTNKYKRERGQRRERMSSKTNTPEEASTTMVAEPGDIATNEEDGGGANGSSLVDAESHQEKQQLSWKDWIMEHSGLQANFDHLNIEDPFLMKKKGTNWYTEIRAGVVTFLTMSYIIPVNAIIMSEAMGPENINDLVIATAAVSCIASILMGVLSNFPFGLAPGMGLNAYFAYNVVLTDQIPWQEALTSVFFAGWMFVILSLLGLRTIMLKFIPPGIQLAMGAGIGIFLTFVGLQESQGMGIIKAEPVTLVVLNEPLSLTGNYDAHKMWISVLVLIVTVLLMSMKTPGAPFIGILLGTLIAWIECWARGDEDSVFLYPFSSCGSAAAVSAGDCYCYAPEKVAEASNIQRTAGALEFSGINTSAFWIATLTFWYNDLIGCAGTLISCARKANYLDENGDIPKGNANMAFLADALGTVIGSCLGTSTVTSYIESASGIVDGGRTGLTAITVGFCFALAIPFAPLFKEIPPLASAPILSVVGALMFTSVEDFNWGDAEEAIPAFITLILIPLTFNIAYGIIAGAVFWLMIQVGLIPWRMIKKQDPFIKFKVLFSEGNSHKRMCSYSVANIKEDNPRGLTPKS